MTLVIRPATPDDFAAIWPIFAAIVRQGETYAYAPETTIEQARALWMSPTHPTFVALRGDHIVGSYILKPNQPGRGDHIANAAFMVDPNTHGQGIGRTMVEHCLREARAKGYRAMQFNLVVATNLGAVALWQSVGFHIVGTLPGAFRHPRLGYVDAHIMFRSLLDLDPQDTSA
jgi:L-amino acid N-acyltransferase YncA